MNGTFELLIIITLVSLMLDGILLNFLRLLTNTVCEPWFICIT